MNKIQRTTVSSQLAVLIGIVLLSSFILHPSSFASTYYVDGAWGSNAWDGASAVVTNGHGPKANIGAAITTASSNDTIQIAAGFYQETNWDLGTKGVTLVPNGTVTVYDSDPWQTDSDTDGIEDQWEIKIGSNPFLFDAYQENTNVWAHGLSNMQVRQHPSVINCDNCSTVGDGIPDWWKVKYGFVLTDPALGLADADRDGYTNVQEFNEGTNPQNANDHPAYLPTDFAGWWKFDEGSGSNTISWVGTNLTGLLVGNPLPVWTSGITSNGLSFDGAQNEVVVADDPQLSPTNALTLSAWVKTATNLTSEVVSKWSTTTNAGSYMLSLTNGQVALELMVGGTYTSIVGQASRLSSTNWHHLAGTYDGTAMQVYLDRSMVGSLSVTGTVGVTSEPLRMGLLAGQLDDVRLYNYALTNTAFAALNDADTDGDGMPDWWEADNGLNALNAADANQSSTLPWAQGLTNLQAYQLLYENDTPPEFIVTDPANNSTVYP